MNRDLHNRIAVSSALNPVAPTDNTAQVGNWIDRAGFEALEFAIQTGTLTTAAATFTPKLEDADEVGQSDAAVVGAADILGTIAGATFDGTKDNSVFTLGYKGAKRFVRLTITPAGNAAAANLSALAIQGGAAHMPPA